MCYIALLQRSVTGLTTGKSRAFLGKRLGQSARPVNTSPNHDDESEALCPNLSGQMNTFCRAVMHILNSAIILNFTMVATAKSTDYESLECYGGQRVDLRPKYRAVIIANSRMASIKPPQKSTCEDGSCQKVLTYDRHIPPCFFMLYEPVGCETNLVMMVNGWQLSIARPKVSGKRSSKCQHTQDKHCIHCKVRTVERVLSFKW